MAAPIHPRRAFPAQPALALLAARSLLAVPAAPGEFFTLGQKVGHIGQSVGRRDIRY